MTVQGLENVGIVFADLEAAVDLFVDLGLTVLGTDTVEGEWVDRCVGLSGVRCDIAMLQTPDGKGRLELMQFHSPPAVEGGQGSPPNALGMRRIAFTVDDVDAAVATVVARGGEVLDEVVNYQDIFRMCYVRGPEGVILMLAEALGGDDDAAREQVMPTDG